MRLVSESENQKATLCLRSHQPEEPVTAPVDEPPGQRPPRQALLAVLPTLNIEGMYVFE